jgi:hypothetical protein
MPDVFLLSFASDDDGECPDREHALTGTTAHPTLASAQEAASGLADESDDGCSPVAMAWDAIPKNRGWAHGAEQAWASSASGHIFLIRRFSL